MRHRRHGNVHRSLEGAWRNRNRDEDSSFCCDRQASTRNTVENLSVDRTPQMLTKRWFGVAAAAADSSSTAAQAKSFFGVRHADAGPRHPVAG
jgi:hypothetical protein